MPANKQQSDKSLLTQADAQASAADYMVQLKAKYPGFQPAVAGQPAQFRYVTWHKGNGKYYFNLKSCLKAPSDSDLLAACQAGHVMDLTAMALYKKPIAELTPAQDVDAEDEAPGIAIHGILWNGRPAGSSQEESAGTKTKASLPAQRAGTTRRDSKRNRKEARNTSKSRSRSRTPDRGKQAPPSKEKPATEEDKARFKALWNVYAGLLPGDISEAIDIRRSHPWYPQQWPIVCLYSLVCKEPDLQKHLAAEVAKRSSDEKQKEKLRDGEAPVRDQFDVICKVTLRYGIIVDIVGRKADTLNLATLGLGWVTHAQSWGVMCKEQDGEVADFYCGGKVGYVVSRRWSSEIAVIMRSCLNTARALLLVECRIPRTMSDWNEQWQDIKVFLQSPGCATGRYVKPWVFRIWVVVALRAKRIARLGMGDLDAVAFAAGFPDQAGWIHRFSHGGSYAMQEIFDDLGYDGPPELFTMYACFFGGAKAQMFTAAWIREHATALKAAVAAYQAGWGYVPIPSTIMCIVAEALQAA